MSSTAGLPGAGVVKMVFGLGNPGPKYAKTRHNAGAWCLERLLARAGLELSDNSKFLAREAKDKEGMRFALTTTSMNESGRAVGPFLRYYDVEPSSLMVIYDEIDLQPGVAKFKFGGGHAGHNGIRDIIRELGTNDFWRLRIGVGHPSQVEREEGAEGGQPREVVDWVLGKPTAAERRDIDETISAIVDCWEFVAAGNMDDAMLRLHGFKAGG